MRSNRLGKQNQGQNHVTSSLSRTWRGSGDEGRIPPQRRGDTQGKRWEGKGRASSEVTGFQQKVMTAFQTHRSACRRGRKENTFGLGGNVGTGIQFRSYTRDRTGRREETKTGALQSGCTREVMTGRGEICRTSQVGPRGLERRKPHLTSSRPAWPRTGGVSRMDEKKSAVAVRGLGFKMGRSGGGGSSQVLKYRGPSRVGKVKPVCLT